MGGGGGGSTDTGPWGPADPTLRQQLGEINNLREGRRQYADVYNAWPLDPVSRRSDDTIAGQNEARRMATGGVRDTAFQSRRANNLLMDPEQMLSPDSNPYLQESVEAAVRPMRQEFRETVLPGIGSQAVAQGAYTGVRPQIQQRVAGRDYGREIGDVTSQIYSDAYGQGLEAMTRGVSMAPATMQASLIPSQTLRQIGNEDFEYRQAVREAERDIFEQENRAPLERLRDSTNLATAVGGQGQAVTQQQPERNRVTGALGGAATGAGIASTLMASGAINAWNPYGWAAMAGGAALGAFA